MADSDDDTDGFEPVPRKEYDVIYKALVVGESSVGKTALVRRYKNPDKKLPNLLPTIGIDYRTVDMVIDGLRVRVQLWDTVGQERYRTMTKNFFRGAKGVLLLFDVTNRNSFVLIEEWVSSLKSFNLDKEEVFLIGNKIDLDYREVTYKEGKELALACGMKYYETSAKTGENVKSTVELLIHNMKDSNHPFENGPVHVIDGDEWEEVFRDRKSDNNNINLGRLESEKISATGWCCYS
ncbi:uncharacterized protein LOC130656140 [Hydractinia symbiolongicarpus]|uniref:uncharacterized protein LOC130656140 n=1 Tax=Hydractinia symbiolongicarpus TaxID=13093 RepID=UPI00254B0EF3|nr:uncharacterized protein LOC130656140 [Hydractinia symbiolongicarpus]